MTEPEIQKDEVKRTRSPRLSAEKALPLSGAETLVKIIKAYAVASNGGETAVNYRDVASAANLNPTIVSRNNAFLAESQILSSPRYGFYVPTEGAIKFARESAWDEKGAKTHLRRITSDCWFGQVVVQNLALRPSIGREDLKKSLAIKCGATEGDSSALDFLIDFILYTGLLELDEIGRLVRGNLDEVEKPLGRVVQLSASTAVADEPRVILEPPKRSEVSLIIHLHIKGFEDLTFEHAARLKSWIESLKTESTSVEIEAALDQELEQNN
jgi:hypothetical protein